MIVESISNKAVTTKFGSKLTYSFKADGEWYKLGFKKPTFKEGDDISFTHTEGAYGKEVDITSVVVSGGKSAAPTGAGAARPAAPAPRSGFPISPLDGQRSIIRQNCVTNAREVLCASMNHTKEYTKFTPEEIASWVINLARKFEAYATGDLDLYKAEAAMKAAAEADVEVPFK
jgi:hypothetical protein